MHYYTHRWAHHVRSMFIVFLHKPSRWDRLCNMTPNSYKTLDIYIIYGELFSSWWKDRCCITTMWSIIAFSRSSYDFLLARFPRHMAGLNSKTPAKGPLIDVISLSFVNSWRWHHWCACWGKRSVRQTMSWVQPATISNLRFFSVITDGIWCNNMFFRMHSSVSSSTNGKRVPNIPYCP